MGCSDSNNIYWKAYKLMQIIDSDLKLSSYNNEFYLISTKSIPNFIELIEISEILENITYHDLYFLDGYEEKLKNSFKNYKLERDIIIFNDFIKCKDLAGGNDEQLNEFIIVKKGFLRIMNFEEDRELEKFVMIKWDDNRARNEIYFPNEELSLFFEKKRLGIYKFIIPNEIDEEGNPTDIQIIDINNSTNKNENNTKYNGYSKSRNKTKKEEEESASEEEDEEQNQDEIKEQTVQKSDKPKSLKDLLNSMEENKPKPKAKKEQAKKKPKNNDEPKKMTFYNSKGTGNANEIDKEAKKYTEKKVFKNAKGLDAAAKENQKIKPTKNYTEKDVQKEYNEDIAKPQFITNKEKDENFVELDKNEDVSNLLNHIYINY